MKDFIGLAALRNRGTLIVTGHRGYPVCYPENTLLSEEMAIQTGVDIIEFDLRLTADGVPVVLHDQTIDRTSDGSGIPEEFTLEQLRKFNFATPRIRTDFPIQRIPTFEEILKNFRGRAGMNIQMYVGGEGPYGGAPGPGVDEVCRLYCEYEMFDQAYLTITEPEVAESVKKYDRRIEICLTPGWAERAKKENLEMCARMGCHFAQPPHDAVTAETFELCRKLDITANVFFADDEAEFQRLCDLGAPGILTNDPGKLVNFLRKRS